MSRLVVIHRPLADGASLALFAAFGTPDATILLREDAVLLLRRPDFHEAIGRVRLLVLAPDLRARGLDELPTGVAEAVDYAGFVRACVEHDQIVNWT